MIDADLPIVSFAVAGAAVALPGRRTCALPAPGPQPRSARLPDLAVALARRALGEAPMLPATTSVLFGTALGCVTETVAFLENMFRLDEATPAPRAFAASVHNAVASRVAMSIGARGECQTFVHGEVSFVQALFAAARRRARGEAGPAIVGAVDESHPRVAEARRALGCPDAEGEGGAALLCGDADGRRPIARVRSVSFARPRDPHAWVGALLQKTPADALLLDLPASMAICPTAGLPVIAVRRLVGGHPSSAASATALAVALLAGEVDASALSLPLAPRSIGIVTSSRFGDVGLIVLARDLGFGQAEAFPPSGVPAQREPG